MLKPYICSIAPVKGQHSHFSITRGAIIYLCNELIVYIEIDRMLLHYDSQSIALLQSLLDCWTRARNKPFSFIHQIIGPIWTDTEAVSCVVPTVKVKNEASSCAMPG